MSLSKARELREKRAKLAVDANAVLENAALTKEERGAQFDAIHKDADGLKIEIDQLERAEALLAETRNAPPAADPADPADKGPKPEEVREKRNKAFNSFLKFGNRSEGGAVGRMSGEDMLTLQEMRDMGIGTTPGAYPGITSGPGIFVPVGFEDAIESALKYYGPMLDGGQSMPRIMTTATGQPLPFPTDNDTTVVGEQVGEGAQVTTGDVTIGMVTFGAWKYSTKMVKVSIELLQDSAFDIQSYLVDKFATRMGRILNTKFTTGAGTTEPQGIITGSTSGGTAVGANTNDGVSGTNTIGSDDFTTLEHSVDPLYRRGALFMMNDSVLASIKKVKDKYGRPLWLPGVSVNAPDTINGYGYRINNDMDALQTQVGSPPVTKKTLLFGDLTKYTIRRVKGLSVLRLEERFADFGQIAFIGFARYDALLVDAGTHPVKYLQSIY